MEKRILMKAVLIILYFILPKILYSQASFTFNQTTDGRLSAGIYKEDGTLVKILWNGEIYKSGTYTKSWDGTDEEGKLVSGGKYEVKLVSNNVNYTWEGVVGNTSDALTGPTVHRAFHRVHGIAVSGSNVYLAVNYSEGWPSQVKFQTSNPQSKKWVQKTGEGTGQETLCVATDDNYVYWGGVDPFNDNNSFIFATKVSDDSEVLFSNGIAVKATHGKTYQKAINVVNSTASWITGLAVQKSGNYLIASRKGLNTIYLINKTTGVLAQTIPFTSPQYLAVDANDNIWLHHVSNGNPVVQKFSVNTNGTLTSLGIVLSEVVSPQALAVSPDGSTIVVADGGTSQQLKGFDNNTGDLLWSYGTLGGYAGDATVSDNKFYFDDPSGMTKGSCIAFQTDGSFWVGDSGNNRIQHYTKDRNYIERVMYMPHFYTCGVDKNDPTRVFADYLEFKVDYTKSLGPDNGSWTLHKNWGYNVPSTYDGEFHRLRFVSTLSNGRTYALQKQNGTYNRWHVVELVPNGTLRFTNVLIDNINAGVQMYPDGSLRRISSQNVGKPVQFLRKPLTGFDGSNNPLWGPEEVVATSPVKTNDDPLYWGSEIKLTSGEITSSNILISFDGGLAPYGSTGYHLGAIKVGDSKWLWKTAKSTSTNYQGEFPADGSYDVGNGAQYAGSIAMAMDRNIFWGYHGEFWKNGQVNKWNHVFDNGLLIGQFGTTTSETQGEAPAMMAGNAFAAQLVKDNAGNYFLYHNDESFHAGVHRWKVSGLNTIKEQSIPITLAISSESGLLGQYHEKNDLNNFNKKTLRIDSAINFDWSTGIPPGTSLGSSDNFSISWTGFIEIPFSENYTFYTETDGGVRLWIDGNLLIDQRSNQELNEFNTQIELVAGQRYAIRMEYFEYLGNAKASLSWSSPSLPKEVVPSVYLTPGVLPDYSQGVDLLEGLEHGNVVLKDNLYGWTRNSPDEDYTNGQTKWWSVKTGLKAFDKNQSPDLFVKFRQASGIATISRDLGTNNSIDSWKLAGNISLDGHYANTDGAGMYLEVLDLNGKIISRFYTSIKYGAIWETSIYGNNQIIHKGTDKAVNSITMKTLPLSISLSSKGAVFEYGPFGSVIAPVFDPTADWKSPKTMRLYFFAGGPYNLDRMIDIKAMRFLPNSPVNNNITPGLVTLTADDDSNLLSASHSLGTTEILVSENNGTYQLYSGQINVGNVIRPEGYWKFKIKATTGRNESSVVSSPLFTQAVKVTPDPPTLLADNINNLLSATHLLGTSEILISENNGPFVGYSGEIKVGDVERAAGYWKFKIKEAAGRNESSVVSSPAFTAIKLTTPGSPTIISDDDKNVLSASHSLGTSEILVSENNGSFVAYSGQINVGNVTRAAGYWKFKIKSSTDRNESDVANSPAFTVAEKISIDPPVLIANDEVNTLSATHDLGLSEILVSEDNGIYLPYSGPINVGNVSRELGYWKFKIRAADGRNESSSVNSPPFRTSGNSTPEAPVLFANDEKNTLSADHELGSTEILVSEDNGTYKPYQSRIVVGDIAREIGYWKFKIKAAPGRNESEVVESPAFTVSARTATIIPDKIFSPNYDGIADYWEIKNIELYPQYEVTIFTFTGIEIYTAQSYKNNWDGTYNGKALPSDGYLYVIKDKTNVVKKGVLRLAL